MKKITKLELFRVFLGLNQKELAEILQCGPSLISAYEGRGMKRLGIDKCIKIIELAKKNNFSLSLEDLCDEKSMYATHAQFTNYQS